jgi:hypothetical protein
MSRAGGVADVDRIEQHAGGNVAPTHLVAQALQSSGSKRDHVDVGRVAVQESQIREVRPRGMTVQLHERASAWPGLAAPESARGRMRRTPRSICRFDAPAGRVHLWR